MNREKIEEELARLQEETRKLIDEAYMCGYKDGYVECVNSKNRVKNMDETRKVIQVTTDYI